MAGSLLVGATVIAPRLGAEASSGDPGRTDWISPGYDAADQVQGLSADGRYALFTSGRHRVADVDDVNGGLDVLVRDMATGKIAVASVVSNSAPQRTGNGPSYEATISADGRYVAFTSDATDLDPAVSDRANQDVFLRDMVEGRTRLISRSLTGEAAGESASRRPRMSRDGRYVVFESSARDLVPGTGPGTWTPQLYRYDRLADTVELVSAGLNGEPANRESGEATLSADGRFVAFSSRATNLVAAADSESSQDVFRRDMETGVTVLVSRAPRNTPAGSSHGPVLSADGSTIAFEGGNAVALTGMPDGNGPGGDDIFVWEAATNRLELLSINSAGTAPANGLSSQPSISDDGQTVAFTSTGTDLVPGVEDANNTPPGSIPPGNYRQGEVLVRQRQSAKTILVTRSSGDPNRTGNGGSEHPMLSGDGSVVAFESDASDLVAGVEDSNATAQGDKSDAFAFRLATEEMRVVSLDDSTPSATLYGRSSSPIPSSNGQFVAFDNMTRFGSRAGRRAMGPVMPDPVPTPNTSPPPDYSNPPPSQSATTTTSAGPVATCLGRPATVVGTNGDDRFTPSGEGPLVIVGLGGNDSYSGDPAAGFETYFCGGGGKDTVDGVVRAFDGGSGKDTIKTWRCTKPQTLKSVERKKIRSSCPAS